MSENEGTESNAKNPTDLTFRDTEELTRFVTDTGKILPRKYTGLTSKQQRHISRVIKQSRSMLLMK
ncbi:30S ribosomal protein S18 [Puniceicoccus vermicola]|uniref:30S ribosomal protein S18 n=1 Tax=Puniceicoccus vermicola TaxID=388746 RepID=A0A7X1E419_9BACT|nr:30S ribosomal protein S18 [Puniceicoccus vermicola]MBC2600157.1 30S ribosomal protein S18 [Puniceicoccus vermicola]